MKDQIYFMQTETPEYKVNKQAGVAASKVWGHSLIINLNSQLTVKCGPPHVHKVYNQTYSVEHAVLCKS